MAALVIAIFQNAKSSALECAEQPTERKLLVVANVLAGKHDNGVAIQRGDQFADNHRVEPAVQSDSGYFRGEYRMKLAHENAHRRTS
jgi:hypothetical protein